MFNYKKVKAGNVIKIGKEHYLLLEAIEGSFISYIPDCDNEVDGIDEDGQYFDDASCKVYAYEAWRVAKFPDLYYDELRLHIKLPKWGALLKDHNKGLYNKISIDEDAHSSWSKIIE